MNLQWSLEDRFKQFTRDLDKTRSPRETVQAVKKRFSELDLDILARTSRIDNGRLDIPVYFSVCGEDAFRLTGTTKQMGKGASAEQAEASAVMELVERYSFYRFAENDGNFIYGTYSEVKDRAISLEAIAASVHDNSDDREAALQIFSELPFKWTTAYNLTRDRRILVPFDWFFSINEFNGTSAGNCIEEAVCQGICEVVERHVSAMVDQDRIRVSGIDAETADDPMVKELIGKYRKNGINLYISDFTLDTGIPTVGVLAHDPATFPEKSELVWTAGTTPNPQKAFNRALTEVAQLGGDFNTGSNYVASGLSKFKGLSEADFITDPDRIVSIKSLPDISDDNIKVEIERCVLALAVKGMDVLVIQTTDPGLCFPTFYTIIPGARFRERATGASVAMFSAKLITEKFSPEEAVTRLSEIDRRIPGKYFIRFYLGQSHLSMNEPEAALSHFEQALDLEPCTQDLPSIYSYMGVCYKELGEYRRALAVLEQGESIDPDRTDIHNLIGFCHYSLKEHEKAIDAFARVVQLNPSSAIDYANMAANYRELGKMEKAIEYYRIALRIDPSIEIARQNLDKLVDG